MKENKCDWNPETQSCSYADESDLPNEVGGRKKCQFFIKGGCKQFQWDKEEAEKLENSLQEYNRNHINPFRSW